MQASGRGWQKAIGVALAAEAGCAKRLTGVAFQGARKRYRERIIL